MTKIDSEVAEYKNRQTGNKLFNSITEKILFLIIILLAVFTFCLYQQIETLQSKQEEKDIKQMKLINHLTNQLDKLSNQTLIIKELYNRVVQLEKQSQIDSEALEKFKGFDENVLRKMIEEILEKILRPLFGFSSAAGDALSDAIKNSKKGVFKWWKKVSDIF